MALYGNNPRYITTIDGGWLVSIPQPEDKPHIHKTIRPQTEDALLRATKWRDQKYQQLYGKPVPKRVFHENQNRQKNTATGIPGVRYAIKKVRKKKLTGFMRYQ